MTPSHPASTSRSGTFTGHQGCLRAIGCAVLLPVFLAYLYWVLPVAPLPPMPASWHPGGPELAASWSIPDHQTLRESTRWMLTPAGPLFVRSDVGQITLSRWEGTTETASADVIGFIPFAGTANEQQITLVGLTQQHNIALQSLDPHNLQLRQQTLVPESLVPPEFLRGTDLFLMPDGGLKLLLQPRRPQRETSELFHADVDPASLTISTPENAWASSGLRLPDRALPDNRIIRQNELSCDIRTGRLRIRGPNPGTVGFGATNLQTGEGTPASDAAMTVLKAIRDQRHPAGQGPVMGIGPKLLRDPPVLLDPGTTRTNPFLMTPGGGMSPGGMLLTGRLAIAQAKGGRVLAGRILASRTTIEELNLWTSAQATPLPITDTSLLSALQHELELAWYSPLAAIGWSDDEVLLLHLVMGPPAQVNHGKPLLRLGVLDTTRATIDWHGYIPVPPELDDQFVNLFGWDAAVFGDKLLLTCMHTRDLNPGNLMAGSEEIAVAVQIALPEGLRSKWWGELETAW